MKLGFVCTNYNNSSFTRAAIASLIADDQVDSIQIVVVDNGSDNEDIESLKQIGSDFPSVSLIFSNKNVGYFPGLNIGIEYLRDKFPEVRIVVIGNNDLIFPSNFTEKIRNSEELFQVYAVVAPDLVTPDGVHQNPHVLKPISGLRQLLWEIYYSSYPAAAVIGWAARVTRTFTVRAENAPGSQLYTKQGAIEQGYGACYLLGPIFFHHFSSLLAPTFLMQEEFFLTEQLRSIDQLVYYEPQIIVYHQTHATTSKIPGRRRWLIARDSHRVYKQYKGASRAQQLRFIETGGRTDQLD